MFGTTVGPSRKPVEGGVEKWHYNGIRRKDGIIVPPMPDKKKRIVNTSIQTPIIQSPNQITSTVMGSPVVVVNPRPISNLKSEPTSVPAAPILKAQLSAPLRPATPPSRVSPQVSFFMFINIVYGVNKIFYSSSLCFLERILNF